MEVEAIESRSSVKMALKGAILEPRTMWKMTPAKDEAP
jgi:hypothetical protein